jgi:hypothetical protein
MSWKTDALDHAKRDSPKESVGLLLNVILRLTQHQVNQI